MLDKAGTFKRLAQITNTHKRESVLVVTVGTLDATAWLMVTGTPDSPMPVLTQPQAYLGAFCKSA